MTVKEICELHNPHKVYCYCNAPKGLEKEEPLFYDIGYWEDGHLIAEDFYENDEVERYTYDEELNRVNVMIRVLWR